MVKTTDFTGGSASAEWSNGSNWTNGIPTNGDNVVVDEAEGYDDIPSLSLASLTLSSYSSQSYSVAVVENGTLTIDALIGNPYSQLWVTPLAGGPATSPSTAIINSITTPNHSPTTPFFINAFGSATVVDNASSDPGVAFDIGNGATVVVAGNGAGSASQFDFGTFVTGSGIQRGNGGGIATIEFENPTPGSQAGLFNLGAGDIIELPGTAASASIGQGELTISTNIGTYSFAYSKAQSTSVLGYTTYFDNTTGLEAIAFDAACFCRGTMILTPSGEAPVERLAVGDLVVTASGPERRLVWIGTGQVMVARGRRSAATPLIVCRGALGHNVPKRDLHVTKGHSLFLDGVLIPVEFLVNHRSIRWDDHVREVTIFHLELETHDVLVADGAPAESYRDDGNRWMFRNANTGWDQPAKAPCAPVLTGGPVVDAVWRRLFDRVERRDGLPLTDDADLHLLVDGVRVDGVREAGRGIVFTLYHPPREVRLVSRAGSPAELGLARDPRVLGVAVRQIRFWRGPDLRVFEAADEALSEGFHGFEPADDIRWTNGDARIPNDLFSGFSGTCILEVLLEGSANYLLLAEEAA